MDGRLRAAFGGAGSTGTPVIAYGLKDGPREAAATTTRFATWGQGFGAFGSADGDGNAAGFDRQTSGFLVGADGRAEGWRIGVLSGYSQSSFDFDRGGASSDNIHFGAYAGTEWGRLAFRSGLAYTWHDIETRRLVAFDGFNDKLTAGYDAGATQFFGEFGYQLGSGTVKWEPFANLAYVNLDTDGFKENGGAAALTSSSATDDATFSTLGVRAETAFRLGAIDAALRGTLGWRHAFGDDGATSVFAFAGGQSFTVAGVPISRDAAVVEAGLDLSLSAESKFSVEYSGQLAEDQNQHAFSGKLGIKF